MAPQLGFTGELTCTLGVSDIQRSIAWFRDVLGFELLYHIEDKGWCEFQSPAANVAVGLSEVEKPEVRGGATMVFNVRDIDAARAALEAQNVPFDGPTFQFGDMVRLATFFDPDGHKLMLVQSLRKLGK
ncbi:VOC family protein [Candidatus Poribacteria bacterium]|nr:VOC family protein [Candidatus Poribacteria bacterium]